MQRDMAERGWEDTDLAQAADVSNSTLSRFFAGKYRTARTAKKLATALKKPLKRYVVAREAAAS